MDVVIVRRFDLYLVSRDGRRLAKRLGSISADTQKRLTAALLEFFA
jgi:hypothetical protein